MTAAPDAQPLKQRRIDGRYLVLEKLGEGGMGVVYRVVDEASGCELALKRLVIKRARNRRHRELRFRREFHTMAGFDHPCIVRVHDYGVSAGGPYYTLELLEGGDLRDLGLVDLATSCSLLRDVASALAFLHARRLLHRDIGLRNVRRAADGRAKLIDFGVLATAGVRGEVVGTAPYVPPEAMLGLPLDHRSDLYAFGALAYRLLCARHAYPARRFGELHKAWRTPPAPPSTYRRSLPPAIDELVMSLLSREPLARPASAAEVIDRLDAIAELEPLPQKEVTRGWLQSAALVGRVREMSKLKSAINRAVSEGQGRSVVVEGASGMGKSRLLYEAGLEAQIAGATVVRATAGGQSPYALLRRLTHELLASCPEPTVAAARPSISIIGAVLPELRQRFGTVELAPPRGDPGEDRIALQSALAAWLGRLCRERPLCLLVDDMQRADEGSAAMLGALAHASANMPILIIAAVRRGEPAVAPAAVAALRDAGMPIAVRGLPVGQVRELVRALFGDIAEAPELARWMHVLAGGCPLHSTELARHLVDRGVIRYDRGLWTVADALPTEGIPSGLADAMRARVRSLGRAARKLGEALSVQGGELSLELCAALAETGNEQALFDALGVLTFEEVLVLNGEHYAFRHDALRESLLHGLDDERRCELHLRAARALEREAETDPLREAEVGWHYLRGGRPERAAELLERAGRALYEVHSFQDAIQPLSAALEVLEAEGADRRRCLELRHMLCRAGVLCDRATLLRYAEETIDMLRDDAGMSAATRLSPWIGRAPAVVVGLAWAFVRQLFVPAARRGPKPIDALTAFLTLVNYTASARSLGFHIAELHDLAALIAPLGAFKSRVLAAAAMMVENFLCLSTGRWQTVYDNAERALVLFDSDRLTPLSTLDRQLGKGAVHFMVASIDAMEQRSRHAERLEALEGVGVRFFEAGANMVRLLYHRLRGEEERARALWSETELSYLQLGSAWVYEAQSAWISGIAYALSRDVIGLKRTIVAQERLCRAGYRLDVFLEITRGEYLRERGDVEGALTRFENALETARPDESFARQLALAGLAETHLAAGHHEQALSVAREGFDLSSEPSIATESTRVRCGRAMALAEAARGDHDEAAARLGALLTDVEPVDSPTLSGCLHEARARVALMAGDQPAYLHHAHQAGQRFRATRNPALLARIERLELAAAEHEAGASRVVTEDAVTAVMRAEPHSRITRTLAGCHGAAERAERALELLVDETFADSGFLFLQGADGLVLAAPGYGPEPPDAIVERAERAASSAADERTLVEEEGELTVLLTLGETSASQPVVGVALLLGGTLPLRRPSLEVIQRIASALYEAGDATSMPSIGPPSR
jgi:hypothetical protein